jgi:hypothetical protein
MVSLLVIGGVEVNPGSEVDMVEVDKILAYVISRGNVRTSEGF